MPFYVFHKDELPFVLGSYQHWRRRFRAAYEKHRGLVTADLHLRWEHTTCEVMPTGRVTMFTFH
eukprot:867022-Prymnesium_polylepis.1